MPKINNAQDFERLLRGLDDRQREHLRGVIEELVSCYVEDDMFATVIVGDDRQKHFKLITINASDMEVFGLVNAAFEHMNARVMQDAPSKEMFN